MIENKNGLFVIGLNKLDFPYDDDEPYEEPYELLPYPDLEL